jgi:hypothetical protein
MDEPPVPASINPDTNVILDNHSTCNIVWLATLGDKTTGTLYTDTIGSFPVTSLEDMQAYIVAYDYFKDDAIILAFEEVFNKLKTNGYTPAFNGTDNHTTAPLKAFLKTQGYTW